MAIDEAILNARIRGDVDDTLRFYTWKPSAISLGYFQNIHDITDINILKKNGINFVRRITGGGCVYHDHELTYSIVIKLDNLDNDEPLKTYEEILQPIIDAINDLGISCKHSPVNDIISEDKKISGNAQIRRDGVLLQHGTILLKTDIDKMAELLGAGVKKRVTNTNLDYEELKENLIKQFSLKFDLVFGELTKEEMREAQDLALEKYSTREWNFKLKSNFIKN